jgi:hypothetical protein
MTYLTIGEAADRLAKADPSMPPEYYARQLRSFVPRGLLGHLEYRGHGRTAAALLGDPELCRARLLSELVGMGAHPDHLAAAMRLLNNTRNPVRENSDFRKGGYRGVLQAIRNGEPAYFVLKIGTWPFGDDPTVGDARGGFYQRFDTTEPDVSWRRIYLVNCGLLFHPLLSSPSHPAGETEE